MARQIAGSVAWVRTCLVAVYAAGPFAPPALAQTAEVQMALAAGDRAGEVISALTDGNTVRLRAVLAKPAARRIDVTFRLDAAPLTRCTIARRATLCETPELSTLGWYWSGEGRPMPGRRITASSNVGAQSVLELRVAPRPVVLVHGLMSSDRTWLAYARADGFLAPFGLTGYAVGDGQAEGAMNMGDPARLSAPTHTLPANAAALGRYIAGVKRRTGAEMVDLVAHSMGGLVARYYVAQLMQQRDVAQLLMLGSPHGGSDCSALPSALGFLAPAALELRPAYQKQVFNRTVTRRREVAFHLLAGDPIVEGFKAPCTGVPSDMVVAVDSASAVPGTVRRLPVLHTDMTSSEEVFRRFVLPQLSRPAGAFSRDDAPAVSGDAPTPEPAETAQFTQVFRGQVAAGTSAEIDVHLDQVAVASFALFDPSRTLTVTVRGASGNVINLNASQHGLIRVDDPAALVHLGYGFENPKPGPWRVTLHASPQTGAEFALSVRVVGGAVLRARASSIAPALTDAVRLVASLESAEQRLQDVSIEAVIHQPGGRTERVALRGQGRELSALWQPTHAGLHGIDIVARARTGTLPVERTRLLAVDVRQ
jgi:pimeloyl-ACP methyl ester carboxylesterase